jgi:hypothetical protein
VSDSYISANAATRFSSPTGPNIAAA